LSGLYHHPPGRLSRWGVVDVGLKCVHSCRHCFYSYLDGGADQFAGMRRAKWHSAENLLALVDSLAEHGFLGADITGGEPTAHPAIVDIVAHATRRGLASRIITLGQFLGKRDLLARLLDAGLVDFRFSLHATEPALFKSMTGGELAPLVAAMDELQRRGFQCVTNTTITEANYAELPAIARWIAARGEVYQTTWLYFMPYYQWASEEHVDDHRVAYSAIAPYLREAVAIVEAAGIGATIRYAPQCTVRGMEKNHVGIVGVRHDPHEWGNAIDHRADPETATPATMRAMGAPLPLHDAEAHYPLEFYRRGTPLIAARAGGSKVFPEKCRGCRAMAVCDGIDGNYWARRGDAELEPYGEFRGDLIDRARLQYKAAHVVKLAQFADARGAVRALLAP